MKHVLSSTAPLLLLATLISVSVRAQAPAVGIGLPAGADLCAPAAITFAHPPSVAANDPSTVYTYIVVTGCGAPDTTVVPHATPFPALTHTFLQSSCDTACTPPEPGTFWVIMQASNASGTSSDTLRVRIASAGAQGFSAPLTVNANDLVCLTDTSAPGYIWNPLTQMCGDNNFWQIMPSTFTLASGTLGNAGTPGSPVVCGRFTSSGTYMVSLIRPAGACPADTLKQTVTVKPPCDSLAHFTWAAQCNSVQFTPTFVDSSATYAWAFGDGGTSSAISPSHIYFTDTSRLYTARLIVVSGSCIDTFIVTIPVTIAAGGLPMASMISLGVGITLKDNFLHCNASNANLPASDNFNLNVQNTTQSAGPGTIYKIIWGDNTPVSMPMPFGITNHLYDTMGLFNIVLSAINSNGCADSAHYEFFNGREPAAGIGVPTSANLCAPTTIVFENTPSVINSNPSGTIYVYTVRTECQPLFIDTIPHTNPFTPFSYTFLNGSCEPNCLLPDFPGQFVVTMRAENQCGTQEGDIKPRISKIGDTDFDIVDFVCVGDETCVVNISDTSYYWNSATQSCSSQMFNFWSVSPSSGVVIESGDLGNSSIPILGTDTVCLRFTTSGQFQVQFVNIPPLATISSPCPGDTITKTICVLPQPIANFTFSPPNPPCAPRTMSFTNTSNTLGNCRAATYRWEVEFLESECGNEGGYTFITNENATNATIRFDSAGRYTVRLIVENDCGVDTIEQEVVFGGTPFATIVPIDDACGTLDVQPMVESTNSCNGISPLLSWLIDNPIPGQPPFVHSGPNPPLRTYSTPGTFSIRLTASGGCGDSTTVQTFTIHPIPAPPVITSNTPVCQGQTLCVTVQNPNPVFEYVWTAPCDPPGMVPSSQVCISDAGPDCTGLYELTITDPSSALRCSLMVTTTAVVYEAPPITFQADTVRICSGQSGTIRVTNVQPGYMYDWPSSPPVVSPLTGPVVIVTPATVTVETTLNYTVTVTDALGCTNTAVAVVIVNPLPVVSIVPPGTACAGVPLQLATTSNHPGTGVWTPSSLVDASGVFLTNNPGTYTVVYTFTDDNGCVRAASTQVCVQPQPNAVFSVSQAFGCLSSASPTVQVSTNNTSNTLSSCGNTAYNWDVVFEGAECHNGSGMWNFAPGSSATSVSPTFNFSQSGVYRLVLTVSNDCGTSSATATVTVGEAPLGLAIDPIEDACDALFLAPTGQASACNAPGLTLGWQLDGVPFPNPPGINMNVIGPHTVTLTATNACGTASVSTGFTIHPLPPAPVVTYNGPVCERDTLVFTVNSPTGPDLVYCWARPGGLPDTCMSSAVFRIPNATPANTGLYTVTVRDNSTLPACENSTSILAVVNPAPPIIFEADTVRICSGQSGTIRVTNVQPGYTYAWSPPDSLNTTTGPLVIVNPAPVPDTLLYTVTVTNTLTTCTSTAVAVVIVNPLPVVSIAPPGTACVGVPLPLSANASAQGTGIWSTSPPVVPGISPIDLNPTTFQSDGPSGTHSIKYIFTDNNGCVDSASTSICVQPQPNAAFAISTPAGCSPFSVSTTNTSNTLNTCGNTTYNWQVFFDGAECHNGTGIWNFAAGSNAASVSPVFSFSQSGVYRLVLTVSNDCGTSSATATVTVGEAPRVTGIDPIPNACDTLFLAPTGQALACNAPGLTLVWRLDGTSFPNPPGRGVGQDGPHTVDLIASNACGTDTLSVSFTIYPLPPAPVVTYNGPVCERDTLVFTVSSPIGASLVYCWARPGGLPDTCMSSAVFRIPNATPLNAGTYTVTVRDNSTQPACENSTSILAVVNPAPPVTFQADTVRICSGQSGTIRVTNPQAGFTYAWSPPDSLNTTTGPVVVVTPAMVTAQATLHYTVTVTDTLTTCTSTATAVVIVNPLPVVAIAPPGTACTNVPLQLTATSNHSGTGVWTPASLVDANGVFQTGVHGTYTVGYAFTDDNGCIDSTNAAICVQPQPSAAFMISAPVGCTPFSVTTTNTSNTLTTCGNTVYNWQVFFDGAECHNGTGIWTFAPGSNAASVSPAFNFSQSGVYRLVLTVSNDCGTSSATATVTVGEAPRVTGIDPIPNACDTLFLAPTGQALACNAPGLALSWRLDGTPFANPPGRGVGQDGPHTVDLIAANACGGDTLSVNFTIHPLPPAPVVTYNGPVCERDTLVFTVNSPIGASLVYCWARPGGLPDTCMSSAVFRIPNATPANAGTYTVTVRDNSTLPACENATSILAVVNPAPPITFLADTVRICSGQSGTIRVTNVQPGFTYAWSPPDSLNPTTGPVVVVTPATVTAQATLHYTVTVTNTLTTCTSTAAAVVIVNPLPVLSIVPPGTACTGVSLPLNANAPAQGASAWKSNPTGPTFTPPSQNPTGFRSNNPGVFNVEYIFTDNNGCMDSTDTDICVQPQPSAAFAISAPAGCSPFSVTTTNTSNTLTSCGNTAYNWQVFFDGAECHNGTGIWNFAPGSNAASVSPAFNFSQSGVYRLVLTVANDCGTSSATAAITVGEAPRVTSFVTVPAVVCEPYVLLSSATVLACNAPTSYLWSFAGSSSIQSSTVLNPGPVAYNTPGTYTVWLRATNTCGMDSVAQTFRVQPLPAITASATPAGNCVPVTVSLANQPVAGVTYLWNYGDGSAPVSNPNPGSYTYSTPGTYPITLTATDMFGCSRTVTVSTIQADPVPQAGFVLAPSTPCGIPQTLCLNDSTFGATIFAWTSTPDLGAITSVGSPCVPINAEGTYTIKQVVSNQFGCRDSLTKTYTAYDRPVAAFSALGDTSSCEGLLIQFDNQSEHVDFLIWEYDGLVNTTSWNPSHLFAKPGTYTVKLTVGNGSGCTDVLTRVGYIRIFPKPVADFDFVLLANEWPVTYRFREQSSPDAIKYGWNFGEVPGVDSEEMNPKYRYLSATNRIVTHWVENSFGCVDTVAKGLSIDLDGDLFVPNILEPENGDHPEKKVFLPKGYNLAEYHIAVFARTGQLIWESTKLDAGGQPEESWDGTLNGKPLPGGVFVWKVLRARFLDGREWDGMLDEDNVKRKSNFLNLIR